MQRPSAPQIILLLDDEAPHRLIARRAFAHLSPVPHVLEAADLKSAREHIVQHNISLAVIDLNLNGISSIALIRELSATTVIVAVSTSLLPQDGEAALQAGAKTFIPKNNSYLATLAAALSALLGN